MGHMTDGMINSLNETTLCGVILASWSKSLSLLLLLSLCLSFFLLMYNEELNRKKEKPLSHV